jgi:hypothetical protein
MSSSIRVRLMADLTRYHPALRPGAEGVTVGQAGMWSQGSDRFIGVRFPEAGVHDVLWDSLEVIDEGYLRGQAEAKRKRHEALKTARNVVLHLGPNGGFRHLSYEYDEDGVTRHESLAFRELADEVIAVLREHGISVCEARAERQRR